MERFYGVYTGLVKEVEDEQGEGRVRVEFPWMGGSNVSHWAAIASPMAGPSRGMFVMPEIGDEVLVAFDRGDENHPYVLGYLFNGKDRPPSASVRERILIESVNGHTIRVLDSTPDSGSLGAIIIEDAHGNRITMSNGKISIKSTAVLEFDAATTIFRGPGFLRILSPNNNPL